jgi:phosphoglycerate kinase
MAFIGVPLFLLPTYMLNLRRILLPCQVLKFFLYIYFTQKILWIGPTSYDATKEVSVGAIQLGQILDKASHNSCDVILVGSAACKAVKGISDSSSQYTTFENGSIVWEFLKGRILPGIAALDKVRRALVLFLLLSLCL